MREEEQKGKDDITTQTPERQQCKGVSAWYHLHDAKYLTILLVFPIYQVRHPVPVNIH